MTRNLNQISFIFEEVKSFGYVVFVLIFCFCGKPHLSHYADKDLQGQTATTDMVFVKGIGKIPSFYVGVSEEPNVNYVAYLNWLRRVYVDYPQVAENAKIKFNSQSEMPRFNDPLLVYHMEHPAFAYYPIVGATWYQVNNYLQWKTDRVNEFILIKNGILINDPNQINEANFNTEAYLYGQHDGLSYGRRQMADGRGRTRNVAWQDGILLAQYRLPTEAEWEMLQNESKLDDRFSQYPYGKNYPTLNWLRGRHKSSGYSFDVKTVPDYDYHWNKGVIPNPKNYPEYANGIQGPHLSKHNQLPSNVAGNVKEWLLDVYQTEPQNNWATFQEYFWQNGFETRADKMAFIYDYEGIIDLKDSLGKLPFKIYGTNSDGSPMLVVPPSKHTYYKYIGFRVDTLQFDEGQFIYRTNDYDVFYKENYEVLLALYSVLKYDDKLKIYEWRRYEFEHFLPKDLKSWLEQLEYVSLVSKSRYSNFGYDGIYRRLNSDSLSKEVKSYFEQKWNATFTSKTMYIGMTDYKIHIKTDSNFYKIEQVPVYERVENVWKQDRLIRGGTWQKPDFANREALAPDSARNDVGFRCVLPYGSTPVNKKFKVKWD